MTPLRSLLRRRGLAVFVDLRAMARALTARVPVAVARRMAEYVLIDHQRVPLGSDADVLRHLGQVRRTRHGMGFTASARPRVARVLAPLPLPSLDVRIALRREAREGNRPESA